MSVGYYGFFLSLYFLFPCALISELVKEKTLIVEKTNEIGFLRMNPDVTGIRFQNRLEHDSHTENQILLNGSGVAAGDIDGDGRCDIYFCSLDGRNSLYRNLGNWRFEDIAEESNVDFPNLLSSGTALADLDGDGDLDLIINTVGQGTWILGNNGSGVFHRIEQPEPLNPNRGGMSLALADIDSDGDLDGYIANYRRTTIRDQLNAKFKVEMHSGQPVVVKVNGEPVAGTENEGRFSLTPEGKMLENGEPDLLLINDGKAHFQPIEMGGGRFFLEDGTPLITDLHDWGLSAMFHDVNQDSLPDLYVCNDYKSVDRFWINQGNGQFRAIPRNALRTTSIYSMGVDFADINQDGRDDFFLADMLSRDHVRRNVQMMDGVPPSMRSLDRPQVSRNTLFLNRGDETFAEIGRLSGVQASEWSWNPVFLDVDLDGFDDILVSTGHELNGLDKDASRRIEAIRASKEMSKRDQRRLNRYFDRLAVRNHAFQNQGNLTFKEVGKDWGFDIKSVSHGMALADLDNDGDLDLVINNMNDPAEIYRNLADAPRIAVRLIGRPPNTQAIGAKLILKTLSLGEEDRTQRREIRAGGRYLSSDDALKVFSAAESSTSYELEIIWRSGNRTVHQDIQPNHLYIFGEPEDAPLTEHVHEASESLSGSVWFEEVEGLLEHRHRDIPFSDQSRQVLQPKSLSRLGPGVSWFDLDGDGREDLVIGTGRGSPMGVYYNRNEDGFVPQVSSSSKKPAYRDTTGVLGYHRGQNERHLLIGSSNYEDGSSQGVAVRRIQLSPQPMTGRIPVNSSSAGPLAIADFDGDGDLDLFVGGRVKPGRYPEPADSQLYLDQGGEWVLDEVNSKTLRKVGLVSGALFSDLNDDGQPELILACEWGPLKIFENVDGRLRETTEPWGLQGLVGWWNSVSSGDFNGDGRLDLIAGNFGWNNRYHAAGVDQVRIYYGDLSGSGRITALETFMDPHLQRQVPFEQMMELSKALPYLKNSFPTFESFGKASIEEILGEYFSKASFLQLDTLSSMVFLNQGGRFIGIPLPVEAQFAPVFGISVADFDADGREDVYLAQNYFEAKPGADRMDGGVGLLLKGQGDGHFKPVSIPQSGIAVFGEQRGCSVGDFDMDGRPDLVVTQNNGATKLFRNTSQQNGLIIRLRGPDGNPSGIGAKLRMISGSGADTGPVREITAGSGYWSQSSSLQVMSTSASMDRIQVQWRGGKSTTVTIPKHAVQIEVTHGGAIRVLR